MTGVTLNATGAAELAEMLQFLADWPGLGCAVSIKLETANPVRSFKGRGTEVVASLLGGRG
jgi:threonine dehydratase